MKKASPTKKNKSMIVLRPKDESSMTNLRKSMMAKASCCRGSVN